MDETRNGHAPLNLAWVTALLTTVIGLHWYQSSLTSSRPETKPLPAAEHLGDQPIEARLWQDPFAAIAGEGEQKAVTKEAPVQDSKTPQPTRKKIRPPELVKQVKKRIERHGPVGDENPSKKIAVLIVPTNTRKYAENAEDRIRQRFAVVSALGVANLVPEEASGIGCLQIPWTTFPDDDSVPEANTQYSKASLHQETQKHSSDGEVLDAPFEWFRPKIHTAYSPLQHRLTMGEPLKPAECPPTNVLILWLDEELLKANPLYNLAALVELLKGNEKFPAFLAAERNDEFPSSQVSFYFLGPTTSTYLRRMLPWNAESNAAGLRSLTSHSPSPTLSPGGTTAGLNTQDKGETVSGDGAAELPAWHYLDRKHDGKIKEALSNLVIQCWGATMADELLLKTIPPPHNPSSPPEPPGFGSHTDYARVLSKKGPIMQSPICTDDQLAREIYHELKLRNADVSNPKTHIVFLSEWDNDWGRLVPLTFEAVMRLEEAESKNSPISLRQAFTELKTKPPDSGWPGRFHAFSYARGLDGKVAGGETTPSRIDRSGESRKDEQKRSEDNTIAPPTGPSQIDSVPRLAQQLKSLRDSLKAEQRGDVRAIGVLGTDIYDKLLILRAVREYFPDVLVFTTELDARYWHPSESKAAHNLLVASSFGLQLHPDLQHLAQPFRDSRQTALFNATLATLFIPPGVAGRNNYQPFKTDQPRLFEIGYGGPVDLSRRGPRNPEEASNSLHPLVRPLLGTRWPLFLVSLTAAWLTWCLLRRLLPNRESHELQGASELERAYFLEPDDIVNGAALAVCLFPQDSEECKDEGIAELERAYLLEPNAVVSGAALGVYLVRLDPEECKDEGTAERELDELRKELKKLNAKDVPSEALKNEIKRIEEDRKEAIAKAKIKDVIDPEQVHSPDTAEEELPPNLKSELVGILNRYVKEGENEPGGLRERRERLERICRRCPQPGSGQNSRAAFFQQARPRYEYFCDRATAMRWLFWASWIAFAILGAAIFYDHQFSQDGEPFAVLQGVSAWPADIILLGTIVFSIYALLKGRFDLRKNALDVSFRYQLPLPPRDSVSEDKSNRRTEGRMVSRIYKWLTVPATNDLITDPKYTKGDEVWSEYMRRSHGSSSGRRILRVTLVYLVLGLSLCVVFDWPFRPTRGPINTLIDQVLLTGALLGAAVLTFFVAHASGHAQWLIDWLTKWPVKWSEQTLQQVRRREGLKSNEAPEWLDIQIIAARTAAVDQLFYYPFVAIAMIIIAHTTLFDRYPWSPPLVLLYVLNVIFAVFAMVRLTTAAREAKDRAIRTLELKRLSTIGREDSSAKGTSSRAKKRRRKVDQLIVTPELVNASIQQLKDLNEGAFRKFTQRPIFTATSFLGAATVFKVLDLLVK